MVEACVGGGYPQIIRSLPRENEPQVLETPQRGSVAARREEQELFFLIIVQGVQHFPEPLDHLVVLVKPLVSRASLELLEVQVFFAADEIDNLVHRKQLGCHVPAGHTYSNAFFGDDLVEARVERIVLFFDAEVEVPVEVALDELVSVFPGQSDALPARHELEDFLGPEIVVANRHGHVEVLEAGLHVFDVPEGVEKVRLELLEVLERGALAEEFLVDDSGELEVQEHAVVDRERQQRADQLEVQVALEARLVEPHEPVLEGQPSKLRFWAGTSRSSG